MARCLQNAIRMRFLQACIAVICFATPACVTTTTETRLVRDGERRVLVAPKANAPTLDARVSYEAGLVRGHLTWANRCRLGVESLSHEEAYEVTKPNNGAGIASILVGAFVGVISGAILSSVDTFSDQQTCGTNLNGNYQCSSPRADATIGGIGGIITGATLGVAGLATLGMKPTRKPLEPIPHPPELTKVTDPPVACGQGPVVGVGISMIRSGVRVASSSTNSEGDFALVVPARVTGPMQIVVDAVPWGTALTRTNEQLATIDIPAEAERDANPKPESTPSSGDRP